VIHYCNSPWLCNTKSNESCGFKSIVQAACGG
jgi:hypothetical protein